MPWEPGSGYTRIACAEPCEVHTNDALRAAVVWNVSVLGAYLVMEPMPDVGQTIRLTFCLPDDPQPIRAEGLVRWLNPPSRVHGVGMKAMALPPGGGLEFTTLADADRRRIEQRIKAALAAV